jgi:hypothetical protein
MQEALKSVFKTSTDIEEVRRIGLYEWRNKRPILIKLRTRQNKLEIRKRVEHLKGTDIRITEDYTKKVQQERKQLIAHLRQAKRKGYKAMLEHDKLITYWR